MKKYTYLIFGIILIAAASCSKKDTSAPMIFLEGETDPYRVVVGSWFEDPGITANDNVDGSSIISKVTLTHDIPGLPSEATTITELEGFLTRTGEYSITYTVTDEAGNVGTATRTVEVYNEAEKYAIDYYYTKTSDHAVISPDVTESEGVTMTLDYDTRENWRIKFSKLSNLSGINAYGDITKNTTNPNNVKYEIEIPYQEFTVGNYNYRVRGTGLGLITDTLFYTIEISYQIDRDNTVSGGSTTDFVDERYVRI
jgi:hypothetical protein